MHLQILDRISKSLHKWSRVTSSCKILIFSSFQKCFLQSSDFKSLSMISVAWLSKFLCLLCTANNRNNYPAKLWFLCCKISCNFWEKSEYFRINLIFDVSNKELTLMNCHSKTWLHLLSTNIRAHNISHSFYSLYLSIYLKYFVGCCGVKF